MPRGLRLFFATLYGVLIIPAFYMGIVIYGLTGLDTGPHITPMVASFAALVLTLIVSTIRLIKPGGMEVFYAALPFFPVVLILIFRTL